MILRRRSIDPSQLEDCVKRYLEIRPEILARRQHYALLRVLEFVRRELGASSIGEVLSRDSRAVTTSLQAYVAEAVRRGLSA
ncbi:MAG: hypothetical protein QXT86_11735, partial [Archaeoglobaceae archaeon]